MREYTTKLKLGIELVDLNKRKYSFLLKPETSTYTTTQKFARELRSQDEYGMLYPSVRNKGGKCLAIFRPTALEIPTQGRHLDYIWNGYAIEVRESKPLLI